MASTSRSKCRRLEGKVALVTAATAGIGKATVERLADEGASVYLCSRKQKSVDEAVQEMHSKGYTNVGGCACHVGDAEQRKAYINNAIQRFGRIDILVSNAAVSPAAAAISETSSDSVDKILDINVKAAIMLVQEALPHMSRGGSIIFMSSVTAYNPPLPIGVYAISKTALLGLTKGLAAELGTQGIRVNGIAPGIIPTKLSAYLVQDPEMARQTAEQTHLKELGRPEDIAAAVAYLASDDARYVTGETLVVAGGMPSKL